MNAERVKKIRAAYNLTPAQLAKLLGVSRSAVYAWEEGPEGRYPPGPHERVILLRLEEAARDPAAFHKAFEGIRKALELETAPPPKEEASAGQEAAVKAAIAGGVLGFGLGVLLAALFSESRSNPNEKKEK